jgi:hypothetical protein
VIVVREMMLVAPQLVPLSVGRAWQNEGARRNCPFSFAGLRIGIEGYKEGQETRPNEMVSGLREALSRCRKRRSLSPSSSTKVIQKWLAQSFAVIA